MAGLSIGINNLNISAQWAILKIYCDGIINKTSNTVGYIPLNKKRIAIGGWSGRGIAFKLTEILPQVFVYNRALSEAEIMQIFNAKKQNIDFNLEQGVNETRGYFICGFFVFKVYFFNH